MDKTRNPRLHLNGRPFSFQSLAASFFSLSFLLFYLPPFVVFLLSRPPTPPSSLSFLGFTSRFICRSPFTPYRAYRDIIIQTLETKKKERGGENKFKSGAVAFRAIVVPALRKAASVNKNGRNAINVSFLLFSLLGFLLNLFGCFTRRGQFFFWKFDLSQDTAFCFFFQQKNAFFSKIFAEFHRSMRFSLGLGFD